jgi:glycosyltransferase involved in cell wall biosynthesis
MSPLEQLSIIVPTRNEAANVEAFLSSVPEEIELIVVDNSTDGTADIVRSRRPRRTTVLECNDSLTAARQRGALAARTRWLLFTDADIEFAPEFFAVCAECLDADRAGTLAMIFGPKLSADEFEGHYRRLAVAQRALAALRIPAASGSNMLVRADAFAAVRGFDETLTCNEDSELGWRIARAGFAWRCNPRLIAFATDHRRLRRGQLRKTSHTVMRCIALYLGLIPRRWRGHDWGYWRGPHQASEILPPRSRVTSDVSRN